MVLVPHLPFTRLKSDASRQPSSGQFHVFLSVLPMPKFSVHFSILTLVFMSAPMVSSSHSTTFSSMVETAIVVVVATVLVVSIAVLVVAVESATVESDTDDAVSDVVLHASSPIEQMTTNKARFIGSVA